jgi:hypothetical protein
MGNFGAAATRSQHVADAPKGEADDQHAEEHERDDVAGVLAEFIHDRMVLFGAPCLAPVPQAGNQAGL